VLSGEGEKEGGKKSKQLAQKNKGGKFRRWKGVFFKRAVVFPFHREKSRKGEGGKVYRGEEGAISRSRKGDAWGCKKAPSVYGKGGKRTRRERAAAKGSLLMVHFAGLLM